MTNFNSVEKNNQMEDKTITPFNFKFQSKKATTCTESSAIENKYTQPIIFFNKITNMTKKISTWPRVYERATLSRNIQNIIKMPVHLKENCNFRYRPPASEKQNSGMLW